VKKTEEKQEKRRRRRSAFVLGNPRVSRV